MPSNDGVGEEKVPVEKRKIIMMAEIAIESERMRTGRCFIWVMVFINELFYYVMAMRNVLVLQEAEHLRRSLAS